MTRKVTLSDGKSSVSLFFVKCLKTFPDPLLFALRPHVQELGIGALVGAQTCLSMPNLTLQIDFTLGSITHDFVTMYGPEI